MKRLSRKLPAIMAMLVLFGSIGLGKAYAAIDTMYYSVFLNQGETQYVSLPGVWQASVEFQDTSPLVLADTVITQFPRDSFTDQTSKTISHYLVDKDSGKTLVIVGIIKPSSLIRQATVIITISTDSSMPICFCKL